MSRGRTAVKALTRLSLMDRPWIPRGLAYAEGTSIAAF